MFRFEKKNVCIVDSDVGNKFDWDRYLESHSLEPVPNFAFQHVSFYFKLHNSLKYLCNFFHYFFKVDKCLQSLLEVGMMVEVQTSPRPRFWLAHVTLKCGPFLRWGSYFFCKLFFFFKIFGILIFFCWYTFF